MGALLDALGQAWPRLLIYPGGLSALGLAWLLARWMAFIRTPHPDAERLPPHQELIAALPPLLALTLLPIPPARTFPYGIDLLTALALLGWPQLYSQAVRGALVGTGLRTLLQGYSLLLLGTTAMSAGAGGIELRRLLRAPDTALGWGLMLGGSGLWLLGQARLYRKGRAAHLGDLGCLWIGAMPMLAALTVGAADRLPSGWAGWALPPLALIIAALMLGAARRITAPCE